MLSKHLMCWVATTLTWGNAGCGSGSSNDPAPPAWPKQVTLHAVSTNGDDGVRLSDGVIVTGPGDFNLAPWRFLTLRSPRVDSFCKKGIVNALTDVPADLGACPDSSTPWGAQLALSSYFPHTSEESSVIGLGALARDAGSSLLVVGH